MASPIDVSVHANVKAISRKLSSLAQKQIGFATAQALTELAKEVRLDESQNIAHTFNRPKKFTINSIGVQGARKETLTAKVYVKPVAAKYLHPYEDGGSHFLPGRALLNPKSIKLDKNGQLPRGVLDRLKARKDVFIGPVMTKSGVVNGVWQRPYYRPKGAERGRSRQAGAVDARSNTNGRGRLKLLIRFGDALAVNKRLNYRSRAQAMIDRRFNAVFGTAMAKALATAR